MKKLGRSAPCALTERVLQFGEGNFLRGFFDWMIDRYNKEAGGDIGVVVVQPLQNGMCGALDAQDGLYTLYLRGLRDGEPATEKRVVECISRTINPYGAGWQEFTACAANPDLRFIVSNTTEAGIEYVEGQDPSDTDHITFPARMTLLLKARFERSKRFPELRGFVFLPCELIDDNGAHLRECILKYAAEWRLGQEFIGWIDRENVFCSTLVDRIVTGYPRAEAAALEAEQGWYDDLIDTAELFHLWVIEGPKRLSEELPLDKCGINVIWTDDVTPYKRRKVRILNGAHTMMVPAALLCGLETVREAVSDPDIGTFMRRGLYDEIIPTLDLPREELESFAAAVEERFANPYIKHMLTSIVLNSVSKFAVRVLPSMLEYRKRNGSLPPLLTLSFAALITYYRTGAGHDVPEAKKFLETSDTAEVLASKEYWGEDLGFMLPELDKALSFISVKDMREAIRAALAGTLYD